MALEAARARVRDELVERLRRTLALRPPADARAVVLFGSLARGDFDGRSDVDLMVVGRRDGLDRAGFLGLGRHLDVVLSGPGEFTGSGSPVVRAAREKGVRLWPWRWRRAGVRCPLCPRAQMSRFATLSAFSWMGSRPRSTAWRDDRLGDDPSSPPGPA